MKPLQSLVTWLTYDVSVGLMVRDFLPLSTGALDQRLQQTGLAPTRVGAATRQALRHSLRVLAVAFHGLRSMPDVPDVTARAFEDTFEAAGLPGDPLAIDQARIEAVAHCKQVLEALDRVFELDSLDEEMVYSSLAFSEAILNPRALRMQAQLGSFYVKEALKQELPEDSPLLEAPEAYGYLEDGVLYFFSRQLQEIPEVVELLATMNSYGPPEIARRLAAETEAELLASDEVVTARQSLAAHLAERIEVARSQEARRGRYATTMAPILEELDRLYVALERQRPYDTRRFTRGHETAKIQREEESGAQYVMPIEPGREVTDEGSHNPEQVLNRANKYFAAGRTEKAVQLYNRAIDLDPGLARAHFNLSQAYIRRGENSNALNSYQEAVRLNGRLRIVPDEYEIESILGAGGMGLLFRVRELAHNRTCTLRVLNPKLTANAERMKLFIEHLKSLRKLDREGPLRVFDLRKFREHYLLASQYAAGWSLRQVLDSETRLPQVRAARIFRDLARQINAAHAGDVLHLNLKPSCVFLGPEDQVQIGDFSLMSLLEPDRESLEASGLPLEYLAPEQQAGQEAEEPADVYALAMILYEMLFGERWQPDAGYDSEEEIDPQLIELIRAGTRGDPDDRCTLHHCRQTVKKVLPVYDTDSIPRLIMVGDSPEPVQAKGGKRPREIPKGMTLIPAGPFRMGQDGDPHAGPSREVTLDAFLIDIKPVTNADYRLFLLKTGHRSPFVNAPWTRAYNWKRDKFPPGTADHPVVLVSWYDAMAYAEWIGKRLPTEAEWEKAARGADGRPFPWGDQVDAAGCNYMQKGGAVCAVDKHAENLSPYGCLGMAGNVWEWVADWYEAGYYAKAPSENPEGPGVGQKKVLRGGAFDSVEEAVKTYFRFHHPPHTQSVFIGFRLARDV